MRFMKHSVALAAALIVGSAGSVHTQSKLANAKTVQCTFPMMSIGDWTKEADPKVDVKPATLKLTYTDIDTQDGTAEVKGLAGNLYIIVRLVPGYLHFMATDNAGPIYLTTIFEKTSHPGKYKAVHTRHEFTDVQLAGFTSRPEQYLGECEVQ